MKQFTLTLDLNEVMDLIRCNLNKELSFAINFDDPRTLSRTQELIHQHLEAAVFSMVSDNDFWYDHLTEDERNRFDSFHKSINEDTLDLIKFYTN